MNSRVAVQSTSHDPFYDPEALAKSSFHNALNRAYGNSRPTAALAVRSAGSANIELHRAVTSLTQARRMEELQARNSILRSSLVLGFIVMVFAVMLAAVDTSTALAATSAAPAVATGIPLVAIWLVLAAAALAFHFTLKRTQR